MSTMTERLEWVANDVSNLLSHPYAVIETATDCEHDRYPSREAALRGHGRAIGEDMHIEYPGPVGRVLRPIWRRLRGRLG